MNQSNTSRLAATTRSYELVWKGNNPSVQESNWAPGYTPAHQETVEDAVKVGMAKLTQEISDIREKWLKLNILLNQLLEKYGDPHADEQVDHGGFEDH